MTQRVRPTYWQEQLVHGETKLVQVDEADAHFISSRMEDGSHRLLLDIDQPISYTDDTLTLANVRIEYAQAWERVGASLHAAKLAHFLRFPLTISFALPFSAYPSSTDGHFHFVMDLPSDKRFSWDNLNMLVTGLHKAGLVGEEWVALGRRHQMLLLLKPGVDKRTAYAARMQQAQQAADLIFVKSPYDSPYGRQPGLGRDDGPCID